MGSPGFQPGVGPGVRASGESDSGVTGQYRSRRLSRSWATARRKPRGRARPPEDRKYNRAFSRRRIVVEHAIGRLRRFRAITHVNRHRRAGHAMRVRAIAGLVNRMLDA